MSEIFPHIEGLNGEITKRCLPLARKTFSLLGLDREIDKTDIALFLLENTETNLLDKVNSENTRFSDLSDSERKQLRKEFLSENNHLYGIVKEYCFSGISDQRKVVQSINKLINHSLIQRALNSNTLHIIIITNNHPHGR